ncbi:hypothetical protein [Paenibacillus naphthalenovorans]
MKYRPRLAQLGLLRRLAWGFLLPVQALPQLGAWVCTRTAVKRSSGRN